MDLPGEKLEGEDGTAFPMGAPVDGRVEILASGTIRDGSRVINHDGFDVQEWETALKGFDRLRRAMEEARVRLVTAPALLSDLFWSFFKRSPIAQPPVPLSSAYEVNGQIVRQIMSTVEWDQVRNSGTIGDALTSTMATIGVATKALAALDDATVARINHLHELESGTAQLFANAEALTDLAEQARGDRVKQLVERAEAYRRLAVEKTLEVKAEAQSLEVESEARADTVRQISRRACASAEDEIEDLLHAVHTYSGGYGGGNTQGSPLTAKEKMALAAKVGKSTRLKMIAAICGRLTRIALSVQHSKVLHPPDEVTSITFGRDIDRLLGSELALLADPDLEELFYYKFALEILQQYDLIGHERQGQGPIIVSLDNSGSMNETILGTTKEVWSKGVTLALLAIARLQKRDLVVIHFAGSEREIAVHRFPKGQGSHAEVIACCEHFFNGGTVFEPWMGKALEFIDESAFNRADVICISDGLTFIADSVVAEWNQRRKERGMRAYGVLIGTDDGAGVLASVTDAVMALHDLQDEGEILQTIFAV